MLLWLVVLGTIVVMLTLLNALGAQAQVLADGLADTRRRQIRALQDADDAAEAAGRAAALEPLALNSDGSVAEPIIGVVEKR